MTIIKTFFVQLCLLGPKMLENVPAYAYGTYNRYHFWAPMQITVAVLLIFAIFYLITFKFTWSRRRWLIAYMRFFTNKKKMVQVVDSSYTIIFAIIAGLLYHPYFFAHRIFLDEHDRRAQFYGYSVRWANKRLKTKNKKKIFWKCLAYYMGEFALEIPRSTYKEFDYYYQTYWGFTPNDFFDSWDHADEAFFISNSEFHNLMYAHFYLFSELTLKAQLRNVIFVSFREKDKIQNSSDLDGLVDLFYDNYIKAYVPTYIWWHPAARNASIFSSEIRYTANLLRITDRLPSLFQMKAEYLYFLGYSYPHTYPGVAGFETEFKASEDIRRSPEYFNQVSNMWMNFYHLAYRDESEEFNEFARGARWSDLNTIDDYNRLHAVKMLSWHRLEKYWRFKRSKVKRSFIFINYLPIGVDLSYSNVTADEWTDQVDRARLSHRYPVLPTDLLLYKGAVTPGSWTWKRRKATPRWYRYYWKYWDKKKKKMRTWNREGQDLSNYWRITDNFFIRYHKRMTYGFFSTLSFNDLERWNNLVLLSPVHRARDFYLFLYFKGALNDDNIESEEPMDWDIEPFDNDVLLPGGDMFSDGYGPLYSAFNYYYHFYYITGKPVLADPVDVFDEWGPMSDSTFAHVNTMFNPSVPPVEYTSLYGDSVMERHFANNFFDFGEERQLGFQDPASPSMEGIIDLHHDLMFFLTIIVIFVLWLLISVVYNFYLFKGKGGVSTQLTLIPSLKSHNVTLEIVWTIVPSLILLLIALPSFALIYSMDELVSPRLTIKVIGHQWYWSYEYNHPLKNNSISKASSISKYSGIAESVSTQKVFDSTMVLEEDLKKGQLRLLEVNKRTYLPKDTNLRVLITSADVLHSWAVPSLGVKVDACPGRLNQTPLYIKRAGTFYGQCSEICGVNHAFMPIVIQSVTPEEYLKWFRRYFDLRITSGAR